MFLNVFFSENLVTSPEALRIGLPIVIHALRTFFLIHAGRVFSQKIRHRPFFSLAADILVSENWTTSRSPDVFSSLDAPENLEKIVYFQISCDWWIPIVMTNFACGSKSQREVTYSQRLFLYLKTEKYI